MNQDWCRTVPGGVRLSVHVLPNAAKNEIAGVVGDALKIRLHAQPIEGQANEVLIRYLADTLDVPKSAIHVTHGRTGRRKVLDIDAPHLDADAISRTLLSVAA